VPPPSRSDTFQTSVTIPDQSTIVTGGLTGYDKNETVSKVPILGDIPLLGKLFQRKRTILSDTTEYLFINARIARDEQFADLKEMSRESRSESERIEFEGTTVDTTLPGEAEEGSAESEVEGAAEAPATQPEAPEAEAPQEAE